MPEPVTNVSQALLERVRSTIPEMLKTVMPRSEWERCLTSDIYKDVAFRAAMVSGAVKMAMIFGNRFDVGALRILGLDIDPEIPDGWSVRAVHLNEAGDTIYVDVGRQPDVRRIALLTRNDVCDS